MNRRVDRVLRAIGETLRRVARQLLPSSTYLKLARMYRMQRCARRLGWSEYRRLLALADMSPSGDLALFHVPGVAHAVRVRPGGSDIFVFQDNLLIRSYDVLAHDLPVKFIIDAGANVGYMSVCFLNRYPQAEIVAVEPDRENYAIAAANLAPYGQRVRLLNAAIWPVHANLRIEQRGRADATRVQPVTDGEQYDCQGLNPLDILEKSGHTRVSIFKCDIEGAEEQLFARNCDPWIERTDCIIVEIHNDSAEAAVYDTMRRHAFRHSRHRDLDVFTRNFG